MKSLKKQSLIVVGVGVAFLVAAAICYLIGSSNSTPILGVIALFSIFIGIILIIVGIAKFVQYKKCERNMEDPSSLSHKTYGGGKQCTKFFAYINKKSQKAKNAAVNALGILSMFAGGVGVFQYGTSSFDVFVSEDEIIINSMQINPTYNDAKFNVITKSEIKNIEFETKKAFELVTIMFKEERNPFTIEVLAKNTTTEAIRETFNKLLNKESDETEADA